MRTAAAVLLALLLAAPVLALSRRADEPVAAVAVPVGTAPTPQRSLVRRDDGRSRGGPVLDVPMHTRRDVPGNRPRVVQPRPHRIIYVAPKSKTPVIDDRRVYGVASWYCGHGSACTRGHDGGMFAAAGPALRVGDWRGRIVRVRVADRAVTVQIIDWCACPNGRVLDLYSTAFERLGPLSRGVLNVEVTW